MEKPSYLVVPDTNILWNQDKTNPVDPGFERFLAQFANSTDLSVLVPEVVLGEIKYQHFESARKALDVAKQNLTKVADITHQQHRTRSTDDRIKKQIDAKFSKWVKSIYAETIPIPAGNINLLNLAEFAIWRKGVFAPSPKDPETEKGFRDALIQETVRSLVATRPTNQIAFICNDHLLRTTTADILKSSKNIQVFESIEDFSSHLRLLLSNQTKKFVQQISSRAKARFFVIDDDSSLFYAANVKTSIREKFKELLASPTSALDAYTSFGNAYSLGATLNQWEKYKEGKWLIASPSFVEIVDNNEFHWKSAVSTAIIFQSKPQLWQLAGLGRTTFAEPSQEVKTLFVSFAVHWKARVRKDGVIQRAEIVDIELANRSFRDGNSHDYERYGLLVPELPQIAPAATA